MKYPFFLIIALLQVHMLAGQLPAGAPPSAFEQPPVRQWKFQTAAPILGSPAVGQGLVYFGGLDSVLYALDIDSGQTRWTFKSGGPIRSTPLILGDTLVLNGGDGNLYALNRVTGKTCWTFATGGERQYDFADYHHSSPVFHKGALYFGSGDGHLYAVDARNGKALWRFQTGDVVHSTPAVDNGRVFFGSFDGYVYALSALSGELIWKFKTVGHRYFPKGEVQGSPAAFNGLVFIGARDYNVYALDQEKGFAHWNKAFTRGWGLVNQIQDSVLYTGGADERVLVAADPATGREFWNRKMEFLIFGRFAFTDSMLFAGTTMGKLHGIDRKTGEKRWSYTTDGYLQNRLKYFKQDDAYRDDIYAIIRSNEQFLEVEFELGGIFSTPAITKDYLIVTTGEGAVYCLKR